MALRLFVLSLGGIAHKAIEDMKTYISVMLLGIVMSLSSLAQQKVVDFVNVEEGGAAIQASGVLLDDEGTFATIVLHQADPSKASVKDADGNDVALELIVHDTISRMTLYRLPEGSRKGVTKLGKVADAVSLSAGDALVADLTKKDKLSRMVSVVRRFNGRILPVAFLRANVDEQEVMAGSPIYNESEEIVGLAYQPTADKSSLYILPAKVISHLEDSASFGKVFKPCWVGVSMDHLSDAPKIIGVRPDTPATASGLKKGDVIISINDDRASSYAEVVSAFYFLKRDQPAKFKILRGTEVKEVMVTPEVNPIFE